MFETSVIHQSQGATRRFSLLTISVIAHSAVVIGAVVVSIATVKFPTWTPKEFATAPRFMVPVIPPPLGRPDGGAVSKPAPQRPATPPPQQANQITAPAIVPDKVVEATAASDTPVIGSTGEHTGPAVPGATSTAPYGDPNGKEGSVGPVTHEPVIAVPEKIYEAHEVKAPVALYRPAPPYPALMLKSRMPATVVVRCIIDKNGHVRDPQITLPARMAPFNEAVVDAVQKWRFTPGSLNGQAVETYLSLTVHFSVN